MAADELLASVEQIGKVSRLMCPDCHGALWEIHDDDMLRYRCHVGHAFSAESLSERQTDMLEVALWSAVRALEEKMVLAKRMVERARRANHVRAATLFERRAREAEEHTGILRALLLTSQKGDISDEVFEIADE